MPMKSNSNINSFFLRRSSATDAITALLIAVLFIYRVNHNPFFTETDLSTWQRDWMELERCIAQGKHFCTSISKYPFAYLINSGAANVLAGRSDIDQWWGGLRDSITLINTVFSLASFFTATLIADSRLRASVFIFSLGILLTPLPDFYVISGSLEIQPGIFFSLFALYAARHFFNTSSGASNIYKASILLFLGCLYKDTYSIFWIALGLMSWLVAIKGKKRLKRSQIRSLIYFSLTSFSGGWAAFVVSLGFNRYRYISFAPSAYLQESAQTKPGFIQSIKFLFATIFSPNGGLIAFWGLALGALLLLLLLIRKLTLISFFSAPAFPVFCTLLHSLWWAPFGWDSWGNRLIVPSMMLCLAVLSIQISSPFISNHEQSRAPRQLTSNKVAAAALAAAMICTSASYVFKPIIYDKRHLFNSSLYSYPTCQSMTRQLQGLSASERNSIWITKAYYDCSKDRFWTQPY